MDNWENIPGDTSNLPKVDNWQNVPGYDSNTDPSADAPVIPTYTFPSVTLSKAPGDILLDSGSLKNVQFDQHRIKLKVVLYHNGTSYDLTPYIMQIKTTQTLDGPNGRFTLTLTFQKRWDLFIYSMDYIEISFSRYLDNPPIIMRGFVSNIRRTRLVNSSGKIIRAITVNGENFTKILKDYMIEYLVQELGQSLPGVDQTLQPESVYAVDYRENYGITAANFDGTININDLVQGIIDKMINPNIQALQQVNPQIPLLNVQATALNDYQIMNGPIIEPNIAAFDLINKYSNRPWCEVIIDDFGSGPVLFYRNAPFKAEDGTLIFSESLPDPTYFSHPLISDVDVIEEDIGFSDNETYSYYFTYPALSMYIQQDPRAAIYGKQSLSIDQESSNEVITNPHVDFDLLYRFGFKALSIASIAIPLPPDPDAGSTGFPQSSIDLANKMNQWLVKAFQWSPNMLNGTIRMKGNEAMRIGRYVTQTSTQEQFYIESVDHDITISQTGSLGGDNVLSFQTTIGVTRGRRLTQDDVQKEMTMYANG